MSNNLGEYKVVVSADYTGLTSSINAILETVNKASANITASMSTMTDTIGKSFAIVDESMQKVKLNASTTSAALNSFNTNTVTVSLDKMGGSLHNASNGMNQFNAAVKSMGEHMSWIATASLVGTAIAAPFEAIKTIADTEQQMAGMKQVLPQLQDNQEALNQAAREFIQIAGDYGLKIDDVTESAKLWGRAYKDIGEIQALLHSSSILAVADSFSMTEANKALEAVMMQYGIRAQNAAEAQKYSMKIVDSWTNVAHNAIISAQDLAAANERSASAAYQAGVSFDFLQGMIATMSRNTGRAGGEIGNAIRSMLVSLHSDKAIAEIEKLGVAMYEVGKDGTKSFRDTEQVLLDLMVISDATDKNIEKLMLSVSGGKFQYNKVASLIGDYNELIRVTELSINSQGVAQHQAEMQIDTLARKFQKLKDELAAVAVGAGNSGLTSWLKGILDDTNTLVARIETIPAGNWAIIGKAIELSAALKALQLVYTAVMSTKAAYLAIEQREIAAKTAKIAIESAEVATKELSNAATVQGAVTTGALTAAKAAETVTTVELTAAERALAIARGVATGGLSLLVGTIITAAIAYAGLNTESADTIKKVQDQTTAEERLAAQLKDKEASTKSELDILQNKIKFMEDLSSVYPRLLQMLADEGTETEKGMDIKKKVATTEHALTSMLGSEAVERIKHSSNVQQAMNEEISKLQEKQSKLSEALQTERQAIVTHSETTITKARERLNAIEAETRGLATEAQKQIAIYESINSARLAGLKVRAEEDQSRVEGSTARLNDVLTRSGGQETDGSITERALQHDYVVRAGQSAKAYQDALKVEGNSELAKIKQAMADIQSAGNPYIPGGGSGGTVSDGGGKTVKGPKGDSAYAAAKRAYEEDISMANYSANEKLFLYHQYLDGVGKSEKEKLDYLKGQHTLENTAFQDSLKIQENELSMALAKRQISQEEYYKRELALKQQSLDKQLQTEIERRKLSDQLAGRDIQTDDAYKTEIQGTEWYIAALRGVVDAEKKTSNFQLEMAKKVADYRQQMALYAITIADKQYQALYDRGQINKQQLLIMQRDLEDQRFKIQQDGLQKVLQDTLTDTADMKAAYREYANAATTADKQASTDKLINLSATKEKTVSALKEIESAYQQHKEKVDSIDNSMWLEINKNMLEVKTSMVSSMSQGFQDVLNQTKTFGAGFRGVFSSVLKIIEKQFTDTIAKSITDKAFKKYYIQQTIAAQQAQAAITANAAAGAATRTAIEQAASQAQVTIATTAAATQQNIAVAKDQTITASAAASGTASVSAIQQTISAMVEMLPTLLIMAAISALFGGGGSKSSSETKSRGNSSYYTTGTVLTVPSYDVGTLNLPEDTLAMVHKGESIFPANVAEDFRTVAQNGGLLNGGSSGFSNRKNSSGTTIKHTTVNNVSVMDGTGVNRALSNNSRDVTQGLHKVSRNLTMRNASRWGLP